MINHRDEIYSRPKKTWFITETEKKLVADAAKVSRVLQIKESWKFIVH